MNPAKNLAPEYNPIDTVENIFSTRSFELERRSLNEVVVEVQGKWNNMLLFFAWEQNMRCLHLSCLMDIESTIEDRSKICRFSNTPSSLTMTKKWSKTKFRRLSTSPSRNVNACIRFSMLSLPAAWTPDRRSIR